MLAEREGGREKKEKVRERGGRGHRAKLRVTKNKN